jgi:hypothetical protein
MSNKTIDDEPVCVCVLLILITKDKILPFSNYNVRIYTAVNDSAKTNVLGFRNNFSYDVQLYVSNDQASDNLSGKKDR